MNAETLSWPPESVCITSTTLDVCSIAADIYGRVCRSTFDAPGFCLLDVGRSIDSVRFRQLMVQLKDEMAGIHRRTAGKTLCYLSAARFDQQETTRPHLDAGPEECFLMLGYEPSEVEAELEIADYAKCAHDLGISTKDFLVKHNPMYRSGGEMLRPYSTRVPCFSRRSYQIVCINNSSAPYAPDALNWQGTLHTATILTPDESKRRVINSTMIASAPIGTPEAITESQLEDFVRTPVVRRRGYDKLHLQDDV